MKELSLPRGRKREGTVGALGQTGGRATPERPGTTGTAHPRERMDRDVLAGQSGWYRGGSPPPLSWRGLFCLEKGGPNLKKITALLLSLALLLALSGCQVSGNPLPDGMAEDDVLEQGREIVALLNAGSCQEVYGLLREDAQETSSPEAIRAYMEERLDKAGAYGKEEDALATGQTLEDTGEEYGTAVLYCRHEKKNVIYRIAYSTEMELMGIEVRVQ